MAPTDGIPSQFGQRNTTYVVKPIQEPKRWAYDGDLVTKKPVIDPMCSPPKVIRFVGYRLCLKCKHPFWTESVGRIRSCWLCGGAGHAREMVADYQSDDDDF